MLAKAVAAIPTPLKNTPLCEENSCSAGSAEDFEDFLKFLLNFVQEIALGDSGLLTLLDGLEPGFGALYGKPFFVKELLDDPKGFDIFTLVHSLARVCTLGSEGGELRFPVAEHVGFHANDAAHLADPEIALIIGDVHYDT
jgi:hypothetical protein